MREYPVCFDNAVWIAPSAKVASPILQKCFCVEDPACDAKLYITGLGYFEVRLNGIPLTEDRLIPPASDYFRRDFTHVTYPVRDHFTHRIYYHTFDIADKLTKGDNILEIWLGGGWFVQEERLAEGDMTYSDSCTCIFAIGLRDRILPSDGTETWTESSIRSSNIFIGEEIDAAFQDTLPKPVRIFDMPETRLSPAIGTHDGLIRCITPTPVCESRERCVYDLGENVSALVSLRVKAPRGSRYILRFSECLNEDMTLDFQSTGSAYTNKSGSQQIMQDTFICSGETDIFMPKFVWHAFRYFELLGDCGQPMTLSVHVIHAQIGVTSEFESDSEGLNFLYDAYLRTQLSNYHGSFPSDCPHRERLGYTGDGQITARAAMMMLDGKELYRKWIQDILDCQDVETGHIQHTAPFQGGGGGPGGWCCAVVTVPYAFAKEYGYDDILQDALPAMEKWICFTEECMEDGLVVRESEGGWCLGDWCEPHGKELPPPFVNTCWFIHALRQYRELAAFLGHPVENRILTLEKVCLAAVSAAYGPIRNQGAAMAYAAWVGIEEVSRVAEYYADASAFDTGFLGTDVLCDVLFRGGYGNIVCKLLSSEEPCSFLYMKRHGATTIWERWYGHGWFSLSHPMFGGCARQLFQGVLGIAQPHGSFGYENVTVTPFLPEKMNYARGTITTPRGKISVSLTRTETGVHVETSLPG